MRNEDKLLVSYEKQKQLFETAKSKKVSNLKEREEQIEQKLKRLSSELETTRELLKKETEREFCSFRVFQERAQTQSSQARDQISS